MNWLSMVLFKKNGKAGNGKVFAVLAISTINSEPAMFQKVNKLFSNQGKRDYEKKNGKVKQYQKQGNN